VTGHIKPGMVVRYVGTNRPRLEFGVGVTEALPYSPFIEAGDSSTWVVRFFAHGGKHCLECFETNLQPLPEEEAALLLLDRIGTLCS
jgi:hypothetical protein